MKLRGSDGEPIPLPPDARSIGAILAGYGRQGLYLTAIVIGCIGLLIVLSQSPLTRFGWYPFAQKLVALPAFVAMLIGGFSLAGTLLSYVTWPLRRKDAVRHSERRVRRLSSEQIAEQIAQAHEVLGYLKDPRKRRDWELWLAWLESRSAVPLHAREGLAPGVYRPRMSARVWSGFWLCVVCIGLGWKLLDSPDWPLSILSIIVIFAFSYDFFYKATTRLEISKEDVRYYAIGRMKWTSPRECLAAKEDGFDSGDYDLYDTRTGKILCQIRGATFGVEVVEALADLFPPWTEEEAR